MAAIWVVLGHSAMISKNEKWSANDGDSNPRPQIVMSECQTTVPPPPFTRSGLLFIFPLQNITCHITQDLVQINNIFVILSPLTSFIFTCLCLCNEFLSVTYLVLMFFSRILLSRVHLFSLRMYCLTVLRLGSERSYNFWLILFGFIINIFLYDLYKCYVINTKLDMLDFSFLLQVVSPLQLMSSFNIINLYFSCHFIIII